ncbi:signal transduction histidine kinase [Calothrix sp. NIES-4071]|nr:signal transduction histidine kinase [Calothrix sp. NIES-4071]BAZ56841.1 signal transduction histidine kinase [Calothrix sp. NIES-4105]
MQLVKSTVHLIQTFAPDTPLTDVINFMGTRSELMYEAAPISYSNCSWVPNDCIYITEKSRLLGIFTAANLVQLLISQVDYSTAIVGEFMQAPTSVNKDVDVSTVLSLFKQHHYKSLPIIDEDGCFLGIVTPEAIAAQLEEELQRNQIELTKESKYALRAQELERKNQQLQQKICFSVKTEAQLLQTTCELQEIFQAFPDIYFRIAANGTILSYQTQDTSGLYLPPEEFLGKTIQDVLPSEVSKKFMAAVIELQQTNSVVIIEYSLLMRDGERSYEARLLPSIQEQIIVIIRDITQRKQAEIALKAAKEQLEQRVEARTYELKKTEDRYTRAICAGKVGIWEWNIQKSEIYIDPNLKAMLGYADYELSSSFKDWLSLIHPSDINALKVEINAYIEGLIPKYEIEHRMQHRDGHYIWFLARGTMLCDINEKICFIAGSNTDITVSKYTETRLKASLKEKEVLLKEIHHRVKNNLQVISSLLRLQTRYIKDEEALDILRDSQNRVRAMAMIHESLYQSSDLGKIKFSEYIRNLSNNLARGYLLNKNIKINLQIHQVQLRIDTAIPCGLIINELVSNALKHAFINTDCGMIYIEFLDLGNSKYSFSVSDNGIGVPNDIELRRNQSLGLQLVWSLVEQLEGSIVFNNQLGTSFTITFVEQ